MQKQIVQRFIGDALVPSRVRIPTGITVKEIKSIVQVPPSYEPVAATNTTSSGLTTTGAMSSGFNCGFSRIGC